VTGARLWFVWEGVLVMAFVAVHAAVGRVSCARYEHTARCLRTVCVCGGGGLHVSRAQHRIVELSLSMCNLAGFSL
jgi:hypothetical protein